MALAIRRCVRFMSSGVDTAAAGPKAASTVTGDATPLTAAAHGPAAHGPAHGPAAVTPTAAPIVTIVTVSPGVLWTGAMDGKIMAWDLGRPGHPPALDSGAGGGVVVDDNEADGGVVSELGARARSLSLSLRVSVAGTT